MAGGLAAAIQLASAGLEVKVIERLPVVGGRTSVIEAEGYRFDLGPTFFLYPKVLREIFAGAPATFAVEITNASRTVPAFAIVVEDLLQPVEDVESYRPFGRGTFGFCDHGSSGLGL